jgi:hypothetical protein
MMFLPASLAISHAGAGAPPPPFEFVGWQVANGLSLTFGTLVGGIGGTVQAGDLVIGFCSLAGLDPVTSISVTSSGYTSLGSDVALDTWDGALALAWRVMPGTPDTSITTNREGGSFTTVHTGVLVFRGANASTPMDVAVQISKGSDSCNPAPAAITPVTAGSLVACVMVGASSNTLGADKTGPSNMGVFAQFASSTNATSGTRTMMAVEPWSSGAFTPGAVTGGTTTANDSWVAFTLAIRPA